jgi:RNA polymerase sigma-70 factor (ECF subfamily)
VENLIGGQDGVRDVGAGGPQDGPTDSSLLRLAQSGDSLALEALCRKAWRPVYRSFARYTDDPDDAEDLTQEVFFRALRALPHFENRGVPFTAFLLRIANNLIRDRWRAGPARSLATADVPEGAARGLGPDGLVVESERRRALLAGLDRISPDQRTVLRLRILEGRTTREVAELTDRSLPAVRQLQVRALAALRTAMSDELDAATTDLKEDQQ